MKKWLLLIILFTISSSVAVGDDYKSCEQSKTVDKRIAACTKIIDRGARETVANRSIAFSLRAHARLDKADIAAAEADLVSASTVDPNNPNLKSLRDRITLAKSPPMPTGGMSYSAARPYLGVTTENGYSNGLANPTITGAPIGEGVVVRPLDDRALLESQRQRLVEAIKLAEAQPDDMKNRESLFNAYSTVGRTYFKLGQFPEALDSMRNSVAIAELLVQVHPKSTQWQRSLAMMHGHIAATLCRESATLGEAETALQKGRKLLTTLMLDNPSDSSLAKDMAWLDGLDAKINAKK